MKTGKEQRQGVLTGRTLLVAVLGALLTGTTALGGSGGASGIVGGDRITTFAGMAKFGTGGFSGDGGPATRAELSQPAGVAVDKQGNVYIADTGNERVRKVSLGGKITTIAGGGTVHIQSGAATTAYFVHPLAVAVDEQDNVYVTDGSFVYRVSSGGTLTTFAGTAVPGFSGDGGPATAAQLSQPTGIAVDAHGNVFVSDTGNNRVREVSTDGIITTIAGTGIAGFSGNGGPATHAQLDQPAGVAVDAKGNVYVADRYNERVRKVAPNGTITTVAGTGKNVVVKVVNDRATSTPIANPFALAVDAQGNLYVSVDDHNVFKVSPGGTMTTVAGIDPNQLSKGLGDGGPATSATVSIANAPGGLAFDRQGNLYIADLADAAIRKIRKDSAAVTPPVKKTASRPAKKTTRPSTSTGAKSAKAVQQVASGLEVDLGEMARDRAKLTSSLAAVAACSLSPAAAAAQVAAVADGRQRLLGQLGRGTAPSAQEARIESLLRTALIDSIAADHHYHDWLAQQGARCPTAQTSDLTEAQSEDRLATAAKENFASAFNPLARKLHLRTWSASEF